MERRYIIYRLGSNAANQPRCNKVAVGIVSAKSRTEAALKAREHLDNLGITVYHNQGLSVVAASRVSDADLQEAHESEESAQAFLKSTGYF